MAATISLRRNLSQRKDSPSTSSMGGSTTLDREENLRRKRRKGAYHLVASKNRLPKDLEEEEEDYDILFQHLTRIPPGIKNPDQRQRCIQEAKTKLFRDMAKTGGDTTTPEFLQALELLTKLYDHTKFDARKKPEQRPSSSSSSSGRKIIGKAERLQMEGMWITLSPPHFSACLGTNKDEEYLYTLGRMSFDMFRPTDLICRIGGTFNPVHTIRSKDHDAISRVPKSLKAELREKKCVLRTYDVITPFTIERKNEKKAAGAACEKEDMLGNPSIDEPIQGLMSTYGYALSNPDEPNRVSIWFMGGTIEVSEEDQLPAWKRAFDTTKLPRRKLKEQTRLLGSKLLLGASPADTMEPDGTMTYTLDRPVGGHEKAYIDILYLDETVRISKSNAGVVYVCTRVPYFPDE